MMRTFKYILLSVAALFFLLSCSSKPVSKGLDTDFHVLFTDIAATQATIEVTPSDDRGWYATDIIKATDADSIINFIGEQDYMQLVLDSLSLNYDVTSLMYRRMGASYVASFNDMVLQYGSFTRHYIELTPETGYYVMLFNVNPETRRPLGRLQRFMFTTTPVSEEPSLTVLEFLIKDGKEFLYYYTKPTLDGRITKEPYLVDIVSDEDLALFDGDLYKYAEYWYLDKVSTNTLSYYIRYDISRNEAYIVDRAKEGAGYTIFAAPYNSSNNTSLFSYHFTYKKGMITEKYTNDQEINEETDE